MNTHLTQTIIAAVSAFILCLFFSTSYAQHPAKASVQLSHDNDVFKFRNVTDRDYSFGIHALYQQALSPGTLRFLPTRHFKDSGNKYIVGIAAALKGYTPTTSRFPGDTVLIRPFAGTFTIAPYVLSINQNRLIKLIIETGVRGPAARAGDIQNWFHQVIGDDYVSGWDEQLANKILLNFYLEYIKSIFRIENLELISESSLALGNHLTYIQQGISLRIGLFNEMNNTGAYLTDLGTEQDIEVFASLSAYGRIQGVDAAWGDDPNLGNRFIDENNLIGSYKLAIDIEVYHLGLEAAYHKITPGSNLTVKHSFGSVSVRYKW